MKTFDTSNYCSPMVDVHKLQSEIFCTSAEIGIQSYNRESLEDDLA